MNNYSILDKMVDSLEGVLRSVKATILITPPLMGLLLVSGGALLSAPVIENLGDRLGLEKDKSAAINMVFRHGLYFVYPLSTTIILTSTLAGFGIFEFISYMWPTTLVIYIIGYWVFLRGVKDVRAEKTTLNAYLLNLLNFIIYSLPLSLSIFITIYFKLALYKSIVIGLIVAILIHQLEMVFKRTQIGDKSILQIAKEGLNYRMIITLLGMFVFKGAVNSLDGVSVALMNVLDNGIPIELIIISSAMLLALATGSIQPAVALLVPMIIPITSDAETQILYSVLIYSSGFVGYFISPMHMCQVVTCEYFNISTRQIYKYYKYILPPSYLVTLIVYYLIMYM